MSAARKDTVVRVIQSVVVASVCVVGFWQFARVGFDWRAVLDSTSPLMFFFLMASLPVFGFPISACYIYAGMAFSPIVAVAACLAALGVNISVSYALTHSILKRPIEHFLAKRGWAIPEVSSEYQFRFVFLLRTIPGPPFFFQNLVLSLTNIPFWTYFWVSLLGQGTIAVVVIYCTDSLIEDPFGRNGLIVMGVLLVLFLAKAVREIRKRRRGE